MTTLRYFCLENIKYPMLRSLKRGNVTLSTVVMNYLKKDLLLCWGECLAVRNQGNQMIVFTVLEKLG